MYEELFTNVKYEFDDRFLKEEIKKVVTTYFTKYFKTEDDKETWFNKMKEVATELGYCADMKAYKENPENYKGNIADISNMIRVAVTSKSQTPDLYIILKLLGTDRIKERIERI